MARRHGGYLVQSAGVSKSTYTKGRGRFQSFHLPSIVLLHSFELSPILFLEVTLAVLQIQILLLYTVPVRSNNGNFAMLLLILLRKCSNQVFLMCL